MEVITVEIVTTSGTVTVVFWAKASEAKVANAREVGSILYIESRV